MLPLESVPNFSEGRDAATIEAIGAALSRRVRLLDVHTDPDHHRSVFTVVGEDDPLVDALVDAVAVARDRIDLDATRRRASEDRRRRRRPGRSRLRPSDMERAKAAALRLAERVGELGLPVFLYGELARGRGPAFFRRGGTEELAARLARRAHVPTSGRRSSIRRRAGSSSARAGR